MKAIAGCAHGFFNEAFGYDPETRMLAAPPAAPVSVSHLSAVFGLVEICAELISLLDVPGFEKAWLQYCELYNASAEEQVRVLGWKLRDASLADAHSRLTAYAAWRKKDKRLGERAWQEFLGKKGSFDALVPAVRRVDAPAALRSFDEAASVSTNSTAQWGLAAIQNLCLVGDDMPV